MNKELTSRQINSIKNNFANPLGGLLNMVEESETFLSKAAEKKGKKREWERERYQ